jgi:hypothetical protein
LRRGFRIAITAGPRLENVAGNVPRLILFDTGASDGCRPQDMADIVGLIDADEASRRRKAA